MKNYITIARKLRGMDQAQLAAEIGCAQTQISDWARGAKRPRENYIEAMARALEVDEAWIAGHPAVIAVPDYMTKDVYHMPVMRTVPIEGYGTLYLVWGRDVCPEHADIGAMSVIVGEGVTITQRNWDDPMPPESVEEIAEFDARYGVEAGWYAPDGSPCVMVDGLPRVGWWV